MFATGERRGLNATDSCGWSMIEGRGHRRKPQSVATYQCTKKAVPDVREANVGVFYFTAAAAASMFLMMKSANSLVLTFVAPSIKRWKSYVTFF